MMSDYCLVFHHPYTNETVMLPSPPKTIETRWKRLFRYAKKTAEVVVMHYFF